VGVHQPRTPPRGESLIHDAAAYLGAAVSAAPPSPDRGSSPPPRWPTDAPPPAASRRNAPAPPGTAGGARNDGSRHRSTPARGSTRDR
jgi:hypothetical protein